MRNANRFKFVLDAGLAVLFLFLMDEWSLQGIGFHEIAGLAIFLLFILHKILGWNFIKTTTLGFFGKAPVKNRVFLILDVIMLIGFVLITLSGMAIAKTIDFSWLGLSRGSTPVWRFLHTASALTILLVVGIHIGLHWTWIRARLPRLKLKPAAAKTIAGLAAAGIIAGVVYFEKSLRFMDRTEKAYGIVLSGGKNMPARPAPGKQEGAPELKVNSSSAKEVETAAGDSGPKSRPEGHGATRSAVSLKKVVPYAFVLALFAILSRLAERIIGRIRRSKQAE